MFAFLIFMSLPVLASLLCLFVLTLFTCVYLYTTYSPSPFVMSSYLLVCLSSRLPSPLPTLADIFFCSSCFAPPVLTWTPTLLRLLLILLLLFPFSAARLVCKPANTVIIFCIVLLCVTHMSMLVMPSVPPCFTLCIYVLYFLVTAVHLCCMKLLITLKRRCLFTGS